jgi:hypothetical protein
MFEFIAILILILAGGFIALVAASVFIAYLTQAEYIDEQGFGDSNDD